MRYMYDYYYSQIINLLLIYKDKRINNFGVFHVKTYLEQIFYKCNFFQISWILRVCTWVSFRQFENRYRIVHEVYSYNELSFFVFEDFRYYFRPESQDVAIKALSETATRKRIKSDERKVNFVACCSRLTCRDTETWWSLSWAVSALL